MLAIEQVSKIYGSKQALEGISLEIKKGSCFGLVGPNGAGKSTLMKIIASIIDASTGKVTLKETRLAEMDKNLIGYVPQEICLEQTVTAIQNLRFFGRLAGLNGKRLAEKVDEVLQYIGLTSRGKDKVTTFSGGMKRRLNIGCALVHEPDLLIMDEPTVGIDPQSRNYIFEMIERLKQTGCTIIYASHYMEEVERLCDEIALIDQGRIVEKGGIETLLGKYAVTSVLLKGEGISAEHLADLGEVKERNHAYTIQTETPLKTMDQLIQIARENDFSLERLELVKPRLEDVFLQLTGNELRD